MNNNKFKSRIKKKIRKLISIVESLPDSWMYSVYSKVGMINTLRNYVAPHHIYGGYTINKDALEWMNRVYHAAIESAHTSDIIY